MIVKLSLQSIIIVAILIGCGSGNSSSTSNNSDNIDFLEYMSPKTSIKKYFLTQMKHSDKSIAIGGLAWRYGYKNIHVTDKSIVYVRDESNPYDNINFRIYDDHLSSYKMDYIYGRDIKRDIKVGDTIWIKDESVLDYEELGEKKDVLACKLDSRVESFRHKYIKFSGDVNNIDIEDKELSLGEKELYRGDIIKVRCSSDIDSNKNVLYYYLQKDVGIIAIIKDFCYSNETNMEECSDIGYFYQFYINDSYLNAMHEGEPSEEDTIVYDTNLDEVVFDYDTGLMWQDNKEASNTMKTWLTWKNAEPCYNGSTSNCYDTSGDTAFTYCKNMRLGGYDDWRLPSIEELEGIEDNNRDEEPFIKSDFKNAIANIYWSSNTAEHDISFAFVNAFHGYNQHASTPKGTDAYVRCVRYQGDFTNLEQTRNENEEIENPTEVKDYFIRDNIKKIVTDTKNGWIWQDDKDSRLKRKPWLTEENYSICRNDTNSSKCYDTSGNTATTYCANLTLAGYDDWRLPTKDELLNQVTHENRDIFKNRNYDYWSSTTSEFESYNAYTIYPYLYDKEYILPKEYTKFVRCIREK